MRRQFLLALLALLPSVAHATTRTAATCNAADVQAQVNLSSNGDTVLVPGGTCTWNPSATGNNIGTVNISASHQITLDGQGITTINFGSPDTDPGSGNTVLSMTAGTAANSVIKGFTFNGDYTNGRSPITITSTSGNLPFHFTGNTLTANTGNVQGTSLLIFGCGNTAALVDHNTFTTTHNFEEIIHNVGCNSQTLDWSSDVLPGSGNMIYIETNSFTGPSASTVGTQAIENFNGARVVFRHNTTLNANFDVHGNTSGLPQGCSVVNTRWLELYSNTQTLTTGVDTPVFSLRGGSGVIFGNTHTGGTDSKIQFQTDCNSNTSGVPYPYQDQPGRGITTSSGSPTTNSSPFYVWGNTGYTGFRLVNQDNTATSYVQLNRDYFTPVDGTNITRCESAADVAAGCPVHYSYTPFTYPYPLGVTVTSAPQNLVAAASGTTVAITWSAPISGNPTGYNVYRSTVHGGPYTLITSLGLVTSFSDTGLANGTYFYVVTATNSSGESARSNEASATIPPSLTIAFTPTSLTFGSFNVGVSSPTQAVVLQSTSSAGSTVTISGIIIAGTNPGDFSQSNNCPASLNSGQTCTITVTFTPTAAGARSATVSVSDNAVGSPQTVPLSGTGVSLVPGASLSPLSVNFGNQLLSTPSIPLTVVLTNTGTGVLSISSISFTGTNAADFGESTSCGSTLNAGLSCNINVTFTPSASGLRTAALNVTDNAAGSPQTAALQGTGITTKCTMTGALTLTGAAQVCQ